MPPHQFNYKNFDTTWIHEHPIKHFPERMKNNQQLISALRKHLESNDDKEMAFWLIRIGG